MGEHVYISRKLLRRLVAIGLGEMTVAEIIEAAKRGDIYALVADGEA